MKALAAFFAIGLLTITAYAAAPAVPDLRPGLWEHSFELSSESGRLEAAIGEMKRQLEQMPPQQREMMEQMMEGHGGMGMRPGGDKVKICLTREEIARGAFPQQEGCRQDVIEQRRDRIKVRFVCDGDPPSSGEGEVTFHDPEHYSGRATLNIEIEGEPEIMRIEQSGRWLSEDCGDLAPRGG